LGYNKRGGQWHYYWSLDLQLYNLLFYTCFIYR